MRIPSRRSIRASTWFCFVFLLPFACGLPLLAEAAPPTSTEASSRLSAEGNFIRATRLKGLTVRDAAGRDLGAATDLVLKVESGGVSHVIVEARAIDRLPGATYAVPAHQLRLLDVPKQALVLEAGAASLHDMPRWDRLDRRGLIDLATWDQQHPIPRPRLADRFYTFTLTELLGSAVQDSSGESLGELVDLVIDMKTPRALFGVIAFDPGILSGERNVAVPVREFLRPRIDLPNGGRLDHLVLNISREHIRTLRGFDDDHWPDLRNAELLQRIQGRFITAQASASGEPTAIRTEQPLTFNELDSNNDGFINRSEAVDNLRLSRRWKEFDSNRDGMISRGEFAEGARLPRRG